MAETNATAIHLVSKVLSPNLPSSKSKSKSKSKSMKLLPAHSSKIYAAASKKNDSSQWINKKSTKIPRPLITVSPSDARWHGNWNSEYLVSLQELRLGDLIEHEYEHEHEHEDNKDAQVFINLSIQKHASFGFSVEGKIITSFTRKCSNCYSLYCRKIDTSFNVWVLLSSRENRNVQLPDIGGDPSVIYVKPGYQADLDSLIRDTILLTTTVKDTCSETCEKSEPTIQYIGAKNTVSMDKRWGRLLELRNNAHL